MLDYIQLSGSTNSYTFTSGTTYYIPVSYYQGPGTATFQNNTCLKFASNACLDAYGPVSFPSSGAPVVLTSKDDNAYGGTITNSTANPNYAASRALYLYYNAQMVTVQNALFRWCQYAVECDANPSSNNAAIYSSAFQNCKTGVYVNMPSDTLYLSGDTYCNVLTPVSDYSGTVSGSMTADCGVISVAMINDPTKDSNDTDPTHDVNKNTQSEPTFILADNSQTIVAAFSDTHLDEFDFGRVAQYFSGITAPRSTSWARSTNGGSSFTNTQPLPPWGTNMTSAWQGDAPNPVMAYDPGYPANSSGTVYLLCNCSRESTNWLGFRLWASTNKGANFTLINTNVPGGNWGISGVDRPMIKVNLSTHDLFVAGGIAVGNVGVFAAHSSNGGTNWDVCNLLDGDGQTANVVVKPNGPVYVFWITYTNGTYYTNRLRYAWLMPGSTNWSGPNDVGITLNSTNSGGLRYPLRFNGDSTADNFEVLAFPRAAYANSHIYLAYSDLPYQGATTNQGDIFLADLYLTHSDGSLATPVVVRLNDKNNDHTQTDQWDAAIAANPQGTELFIGYYSRQEDPTTNSLIKAYGAKVYNIVNGLTNATIDCFPISPTSFPPLFNGTNSVSNMQFDPVYPPGPSEGDPCFDQYARVVGLFPCQTNATDHTYDSSWFQDDNTWADADTNYFYYAWCDRSRTWTGTNVLTGQPYSRPDADVKPRQNQAVSDNEENAILSYEKGNAYRCGHPWVRRWRPRPGGHRAREPLPASFSSGGH